MGPPHLLSLNVLDALLPACISCCIPSEASSNMLAAILSSCPSATSVPLPPGYRPQRP